MKNYYLLRSVMFVIQMYGKLSLVHVGRISSIQTVKGIKKGEILTKYKKIKQWQSPNHP